MADVEKLRLSSITWESDTNEEGFYIYIEDFGAMARAIKCGCELEDMLDSKLRRAKTFSQSVPSFLLDDPDFMIASAPAPHAPPEEDADGESLATLPAMLLFPSRLACRLLPLLLARTSLSEFTTLRIRIFLMELRLWMVCSTIFSR
jgi:hypothetical protein